MKSLACFLIFQSLAFGLIAQVDIIHAAIEFDFIPEGIAVDAENHDIYLSSIHLDKVSRLSYSKRPKDFIAPMKFNYSEGVGLELINNHLYALGRIERSESSQLLVVDIKNESLVDSYTYIQGPNYFNDLAVLDSTVYLTDTENHRVYICDLVAGVVDLFLEDETLKYPNGITISDDGHQLFVDSYSDGIRIVDLNSGLIINGASQATANLGIDGLKYHQGHLYGIVNGRATASEKHGLYKFTLSKEKDKIVAVDPIIIDHPLMNVPTTFDIINGTVYLLANSQMEQLNQEDNSIIDPARLTPTYILRFSL